VTAGSPVLLAAAAGLVGIMLLAVVLMLRQSAEEKRRKRLIAVVQPHMRAVAGPRLRTAILPRLLRGAVGQALEKVFGFEIDRIPDYPAYWWVAIIVALPPARLITGLGAPLLGDWVILLTPVVWVVLTRAYFGWLRQRRLELLFKQFPDALAMIVRAVRVGIPVTEAIRTVARDAQMPTAREFGRMADRLTVGMPLDKALAETAAHAGLPEYKFFATALALQSQTGGGLTDTLENLAEVIRKRVALRARASALSSEAKTSAAILAALPFFAGGALFVMSPGYLMLLVNEERGQQILGAALLMLGMGILVMRSMIRRALRS
jgi:tight adherence protein B